MQDDLIGFWGNVSNKFVNEKAVIGYELINEPFAGNIWADPLYFVPGEAGSHNLMPMYDNIA